MFRAGRLLVPPVRPVQPARPVRPARLGLLEQADVMKLVWNAIVKNEAAIIERCVNSLLPHIDGAVVVDTGSTDGTPDLLMSCLLRPRSRS